MNMSGLSRKKRVPVVIKASGDKTRHVKREKCGGGGGGVWGGGG